MDTGKLIVARGLGGKGLDRGKGGSEVQLIT